jgi:hypothetical protein
MTSNLMWPGLQPNPGIGIPLVLLVRLNKAESALTQSRLGHVWVEKRLYSGN